MGRLVLNSYTHTETVTSGNCVFVKQYLFKVLLTINFQRSYQQFTGRLF